MQNRRLLCLGALFFFIATSAYAIQTSDEKETTKSEIDEAWEKLAKNEPECTEAVLYFAKRPDEAVNYFAEHLQPLRLDEDSFLEIRNELESDDVETAKAAFEKFEYLDPRLAFGLEEIMEKVEEGVVRTRMVEVLSGRNFDSLAGSDVQLRKIGGGDDVSFNFSSGTGSWWAEANISRLGIGVFLAKPQWTRAIRAIKILEDVDSPEATKLLSRMAQGHADAQPTIIAKEIAMQRKLEKRNAD